MTLSSGGQPFTNGVIVLENQKPGTTTWRLSNPALRREIEGYATSTSVNRGEQIQFLVNTTNSAYSVEVFRIGWYGGLGGRSMFGPVTVPGQAQAMPTADPTTGLIECNWTNPFTLAVPAATGDPTDWASGVYLAKLTGAQDGKQSYIIFVVRDDARPTALLLQLSFATYQAYNNWGGRSLYAFNSWLGQARKVSFNRPYGMPQAAGAAYNGSGEFFALYSPGLVAGFDCNLVRWLEREGYDVTYCTSIDTHSTTNLLWNHQGFISLGHDEYWSYPMRSNIQAARDRGVNLAFLGANDSYWQVRYEPSTVDGTPNRNMVCYRIAYLDPVAASSSNWLTTVTFRSPPVLAPESALIGIQYYTYPAEGDLVVANPGHWAFANTGLSAGQRLPGLVGIEVDSADATSPTNLQVACISLFIVGVPDGFLASSEVASYQTAGGTTVFAAGTLQWSWGLDDFNAAITGVSCQNPVLQQVTRNVLARLSQQPPPPPTLFFRTDVSTRGNWQPHYGADGYVLPNDSTNPPNYTTLVVTGASSLLLLPSSLAPDALQQTASSGRYLSGWSSPTNFTLDLKLTDGNNHPVALYFWDWNNAGRQELVQVVDAASSNLLDQQTITGFTNGQWWVWQLNGHVQVLVTNLAGPDCLVNAVTFGNGGAAVFIGEDALTQGNWKPFYGHDGAYLYGDAQLIPPYVKVQGPPGSLVTWSWSTPDPRALQRVSSTESFLAAWTSPTVLTYLLNFTDNAWHQVALYAVDPEPLGRRQIVTLSDPLNNAVLDSRDWANFGAGKYLVWNVRGAVKIGLQRYGPDSAIVNGLFFGPPNQPPVVALTNPTNGQSFTLPTSFLLSANAVDPDGGVVSQVSFYANGQLLGTATNPPFTWTWTNPLVGQYALSAVALDDGRAQSASGTNTISVGLPAGYQPPGVQLTAPPDASVYQAPVSIQLSASVNATSAPLASLQFLWDGLPYGTPLSIAPFTLTATNVNAGSHTIGATAQDVLGVSATAPSNSITILPTTASATFRGFNQVVQGTWPGIFGSDGYLLARAATNLPAYAVANLPGANSEIRQQPSTDSRALIVPGSGQRIAADWWSFADFFLDLNLLDGNPHRIALYCMDWYVDSGTQTIQVLDAATSMTLDQQSSANLHQGVYFVWDIVGHVRFRFVKDTNSVSTLLSAVFFDPPVTVSQVSLLAPANGTTFVAPSLISISAFASSATTNVIQVDFQTNGTLLGSAFSGPPYTFAWSNPIPGGYVLTARALDAGGASFVSSPISLTIEAASAAAAFIRFDTSRQGTWLRLFGRDGYLIAGDSTNLHPWAAVNINSQYYLWATNTTDLGSLQRASGNSRLAATWYAFTNLTIDIRLADPLYHRVSLYALDWPGFGAVDSIDVLDHVAGALLDHRDLYGFTSGTAAVWDIKGHVTFRVAGRGRLPALVSGIFFDPGGILPPLTLTPISGTIFVAPTNIFLRADALPDNTVTRVDFHVGAALLGSASNGPPYTLVWTNPPPGTWALFAQEVSALSATNSAPSVVQVFTNASVVPRAFTASLLPDGTLRLDVTGPPSRAVRLEAATNLGPATLWLPLYTNTSDAAQFYLVLPDPAAFPQRFYRATILP